jgi:hypothetical protein
MSFNQEDANLVRVLNDARLYWRRAHDALVDNRSRQRKLTEELSELSGREPELVKSLKNRHERFQNASEVLMVSGVTLDFVARPEPGQ